MTMPQHRAEAQPSEISCLVSAGRPMGETATHILELIRLPALWEHCAE